MKEDNIVLRKSYDFAIRIVKLNRYLKERKREFVLSNQILRAGTSIGANIEEALGGQSGDDFVHKISIAYKEARETKYWINLLFAGGYLTEAQKESLLDDCLEILKILGSIQITMKKNNCD